MRNNISIIMSIIAIIVAGFTLFRNPDQIPYGVTLPIPQEEIQLDSVGLKSLEGVAPLEPYRVYRVVFERAYYLRVEKEGLPTYDSIMVPRTYVRNAIQRGSFNRKLFLDKTHGAINVIHAERLR